MGSLRHFSRRIWLPDQISENVLKNKPCVVCREEEIKSNKAYSGMISSAGLPRQ